MQRPVTWLVMCLAGLVALSAFENSAILADAIDPKALQSAIESARRPLLKAQGPDGSWSPQAGDNRSQIATTGLALLALLSSQMDANALEIERGIDWFRRQEPISTKDISMVIQVLVAARRADRDLPRVTALAAELEKTQIREGSNTGSWPASRNVRPEGFGDRSNASAAIVALHDAATIGVRINPETWRRARGHWLLSQNADGSWSDRGGKGTSPGTGSMTAAGISAILITQAGLERKEGDPKRPEPTDREEGSIKQAHEDACRWMGQHFSVRHDPGSGDSVLNYLNSLSRAGRISRRHEFVDGQGHQRDWYREGAEYLMETQNRFTGTWRDGNTSHVVGTSLAIRFLSAGRIAE